MRDKRCAICREVFTPTNNAQMLCGRCKPYYYETGLYRTGNIKEARALFMRDMKKQKIKVSYRRIRQPRVLLAQLYLDAPAGRLRPRPVDRA